MGDAGGKHKGALQHCTSLIASWGTIRISLSFFKKSKEGKKIPRPEAFFCRAKTFSAENKLEQRKSPGAVVPDVAMRRMRAKETTRFIRSTEQESCFITFSFAGKSCGVNKKER